MSGGNQKLEYDSYIRERELLYRCQQDNHAAYARTILTLSASLLALSVAFLGLLGRPSRGPVCMPDVQWPALLVVSWAAFGVAVLSMLVAFPVNAASFDVEIAKLEDALHDAAALRRPNGPAKISRMLFIVAGAMFAAGLSLLIVFCWRNVQLH